MKMKQLCLGMFGAATMFCGVPTEAALVKKIVDTFEVDDAKLNDGAGNVNWQVNYSSPGWTVSDGTLNTAKPSQGMTSRDYLRLPTGVDDLLILSLELAAVDYLGADASYTFGIRSTPALPGGYPAGGKAIYVRHLGSTGASGTMQLFANGPNFSTGVTVAKNPAFYRLEITSTHVSLFHSFTAMPDGSGTPLLTMAHLQNWSEWTSHISGGAAFVALSASNAELSFDNINSIPEATIPTIILVY